MPIDTPKIGLNHADYHLSRWMTTFQELDNTHRIHTILAGLKDVASLISSR